MKKVAVSAGCFQGAVAVERGRGWLKPWRLPYDTRRLYVSPGDTLLAKAQCTAGVRLRLRTNAARLTLHCVPGEGDRLFDLTVDNRILDTRTLAAGERCVTFQHLPAGSKVAEIWLPVTHPVKVSAVSVEDGASCAPARDQRRKWLIYGSSISQCAASHSPARTWTATAARLADVNLTCMGFGGNCHLEPMVARAIRDLPAELLTLKLGINICGQASLGPRTFEAAVIGFLEIVREKHGSTPVVVVGPIACPAREHQENAVGMTLARMREELQDAVRRLRAVRGDTRIHYFNGLRLLGTEEAAQYLPDGLHPNAQAYEMMGKRFHQLVLNKMEF